MQSLSVQQWLVVLTIMVSISDCNSRYHTEKLITAADMLVGCIVRWVSFNVVSVTVTFASYIIFRCTNLCFL